MKNSKIESFTLVELLIVLALISILATVLIVIIKPGIIFSKARDTKRIADIKNIEKTIDSLSTEQNFYELNYASPNIVYLSLQDTSSTCGSYLSQLPSLPSGWSYHCSATPTNIDGTGWIPIPFSNFPIINISQLFIDPLNKPPYYYSFVVGGSYEVTAKLEDIPKNKGHISANDNGDNPLIFEAGTNKNLTPNEVQGRGATYDQLTYSDPSLVGYWPFDEGSGTTAYDYSGNNNNGTLVNGPTWTTGKVGGALSFDGVDDYVNLGPKPVLDFQNNFTVCTWFKTSGTYGVLINNEGRYEFAPYGNYGVMVYAVANTNPGWNWTSSSHHYLNIFQHYCFVYSASALIKTYINGTNDYSFQGSGNIGDVDSGENDIRIGGRQYNNSFHFNGIIDEVRIYNRALSDSEIKAIYDATK